MVLPLKVLPTTRQLRRTLCAALIGSYLLAPTGTAQAKPLNVVASIKPIHALIAGVIANGSVTGEIGKLDVLIKGGASPHAYALRPSDARRLHRADIVFWIGEKMETFLIKPLTSLPRKTHVIALSKAPGVRLYRSRKGGVWDKQKHKTDQPVHDQEHNHAKHDMHIWLSNGNAQAIVKYVAVVLSRTDPANQHHYRKNAERMLARLTALRRELAEALMPVRQLPYVVFHDAYQYFERDFGLNPIGSLSTHEARKPGAKRLMALRNKIISLKTRCVFAEPQFQPALIKTLIDGTSAKAGILDPMGAHLKPGQNLYFSLMHNLARDLKRCLVSTS